jgi:hypothetical protein
VLVEHHRDDRAYTERAAEELTQRRLWHLRQDLAPRLGRRAEVIGS